MPARMITQRAVFRESTLADCDAILAVERTAFGRTDEATLADRLIAAPVETISIVAELDSAIVGHVLLSRIDGPDKALALAPLAVAPEWREMQIGTELVLHALSHARSKGWKSVFVLGAPDYYMRFGFRSDLADGADIAWQGRHFMALELEKGALKGWHGKLVYPQAFSTVA